MDYILAEDTHESFSHGEDVTKINASFTVSSKISHRKASYNRHCAGQKDAKATNSDHQEGLN